MDNELLDRLLKLHDEKIERTVPNGTCVRERYIQYRENDEGRQKGFSYIYPVRASAKRDTSPLDSRQILSVFESADLECGIRASPHAADVYVPDKSGELIKTRWPATRSLGCNYKGEFRGVNSEVCKWHLSEKDPFCIGECENLWVEKHLKGGKHGK